MPRITAIATALPEHVITQREARSIASSMFAEAYGGDIERLAGMFDNGEIERRRFCMPPEWYAENHSFAEKNDLYIEHGLALATSAIERSLEQAAITHADVDYLLYVSTTGLATPSMDARLIQRLPFRRTIRRLPIWGLGCAGGAASISRAAEIARAIPTARVLVVVVELCGLTFVRNDLSKGALVATSLFGDGAAALLVCGDEADAQRPHALPEIVGSMTNTLDDSLDVMGWRIDGEGLHVVISRDIPAIVRTFMSGTIRSLVEENGITLGDIVHYVAHPGGAKVLRAYEESLGLDSDALRHTRAVLRDTGNTSAVSVLLVLECFARELAARTLDKPELGVLCALGPGFSAEAVLLRWGGLPAVNGGAMDRFSEPSASQRMQDRAS